MLFKENSRKRPLTSAEIEVNAVLSNLIKYYILTPEEVRGQNEKPDCEPTSDEVPGAELLNASNATNSTTDATIPSIELPSSTIKLRHDPALVAFCQNATFQSSCQRGFISLIDLETEYVLAEATRSVSLQDPSLTSPGDELCIGAVTLPISCGMCPEAIQAFRSEDDRYDKSTDNITINNRCYIVNDMTQVDSFKDKPYVTDWPFLRFLAHVPVTTREGIVIGSLCVTDSQPRVGIDIVALNRLQQIASTVIGYLELVQLHERFRLSQSMMQGLGRFIDGDEIQQLWKSTFDELQMKSVSIHDEKHSKREAGFAQTISTRSEHMEDTVPVPDTPPCDSLDSAAATNTSCSREDTRVGVSGVENRLNYSTGSRQSIERSASNRYSQKVAKRALQEETLQLAVRRLFSRASHWIKEACDLDGVLFIDASLSNQFTPEHTGQLNSPKTPPASYSPSSTGDSTLSSSFLDESGRWSPVEDQRDQARICDLLGYSSLEAPARIPPSTLFDLLAHYPKGKVFLFDASGHLVIPKSHRAPKYQSDRMKEDIDARRLSHVCPSARSIVFVPLYDAQKGLFFAGMVVWAHNPIRIIRPEEITMLTALASCIMAEKSKIDFLGVNHSKQDFISSVSHELRSPLHGILATAEMFSDTSPNEVQDDLIRTINTCGNVLMETLDHILEYSKMSQMNPMLMRLVGGENTLGENERRAGTIRSFDFSKLVENVVESVFAGHNYRSSGKSTDNQQLELYKSTRTTPPNMNPTVMVLLEVQPQVSWSYESQIGACKRIVTNIFGNALKYTEYGFVRVFLGHESIWGASRKTYIRTVKLEVEDSGIGMSKDYLKHGLYKPFSQENPLSVGTGLGLNIVRQLVKDLEGTISIESEVTYGTCVKILLLLTPSISEQVDPRAEGENAPIRDIAVWCKGLKLCLINFDHYPNIHESPTGVLSVHARRMLALRSSVETIANGWFGLQVKNSCSLSDAEGDIFMGLVSQITPEECVSHSPMILFKDFYSGVRIGNQKKIFYLSQPFGLHKLAKIIGWCIEYRWSHSESTVNSPISTRAIPSRVNSNIFSEGISFVEPSSMYDSTSESPNMEGETYLSPKQALAPHETLSKVPAVASQISIPVPLSPSLASPELDFPSRSKVLLVEDNGVNMKILVNLMKKANEQHMCAVNGLEAVHMYRAENSSIKLILMDISMPVMDGITATRQIRQFEREHSLPRVRIVAVTCFSSEEYQTNAFRSGVDIVLFKPTPMKALQPILEMDPSVVIPLEQK